MDLPGRIDRATCDRCGKCAEVCPGRGLRRIGRFYEIDELLDIVLRDRLYYRNSGGGVTLSGGEPTLYSDYMTPLLQELQSCGIHTAIQTCGFFDWAQFSSGMLDHLDLVLFDVKLADPGLHLMYTGRHNGIILDNLARLVRARPHDVIPRIPLVPTITTDPHNLLGISDILRGLGLKRCWPLPYNPLGLSKRATIGRPAVSLPERMLTGDELARLEGLLSWAELVEM